MNEEQKEQNITAPVPPDNSNQNLSLVSRWQIKSWWVAIAGIIPAFIAAMYMFYTESIIGFGFSILYFILIGIIFILVLLLKSDKYGKNVAKFGAILCILIGGIGTLWLSSLFVALVGSIIWLMAMLPWFLLFVAGIYYFWKKV